MYILKSFVSQQEQKDILPKFDSIDNTTHHETLLVRKDQLEHMISAVNDITDKLKLISMVSDDYNESSIGDSVTFHFNHDVHGPCTRRIVFDTKDEVLLRDDDAPIYCSFFMQEIFKKCNVNNTLVAQTMFETQNNNANEETQNNGHKFFSDNEGAWRGLVPSSPTRNEDHLHCVVFFQWKDQFVPLILNQQTSCEQEFFETETVIQRVQIYIKNLPHLNENNEFDTAIKTAYHQQRFRFFFGTQQQEFKIEYLHGSHHDDCTSTESTCKQQNHNFRQLASSMCDILYARGLRGISQRLVPHIDNSIHLFIWAMNLILCENDILYLSGDSSENTRNIKRLQHFVSSLNLSKKCFFIHIQHILFLSHSYFHYTTDNTADNTTENTTDNTSDESVGRSVDSSTYSKKRKLSEDECH